MGGVVYHHNTPSSANPKESPDFFLFPFQCLPSLLGVAHRRRRPTPASSQGPVVLLPVVVQEPVMHLHSEPTGTRMDVAVVAIHTGRARGRAGRLQAEQWDGGDTAVGRGCGQT